MKFRLSLLVFCAGAVLLAQSAMQMNVAQLVDMLRSEIALKQQSDKKIADYVKKITLTERLTDKTIIDLEAQGAGPKTVQALQELRDKTAAMKPPSQDTTYSPATAPDTTLTDKPTTASVGTVHEYHPIPPPDSVKFQQILDMVRNYAGNYTQNLPNFFCVQVTRRYIDPNGGDSYRSIGRVLAKVSYNQGREKYEVYMQDGKLLNDVGMESVKGGAISTGEFGSLMNEIFAQKSEAEFGWEKWTTLRGRVLAVFNYFIDSGHSGYYLTFGEGGSEQRIITAHKGLVYVDPKTGEIERIKFIAVNIPRGFPIDATEETLDYDAVNIGGQNFICPLAAKVFMSAGREKSKNEIEFRDYRKLDVSSGIVSFNGEAPEPLPADKLEEKPASTSTPAQPAQHTAQQQTNSSSDPFSLPTPPPPPPQ